MKFKSDLFGYAIIVSLCLSLITILVTFLFGKWDVRYIYNIFYFTFFNFTVLSFNAMLFTNQKLLNEKIRKFLGVAFIVLYCFIYVAATVSFLITGQITRIQTLLFLAGIGSIWVTLIFLLFLVTILTLFIFLLYKPIPAKADKQERKKIQFIFYVSIFLFILTVLANPLFLHIENSLIHNNDILIVYESEDPILQDTISALNFTYQMPNVIFVVLESVSADRVGFYGYERNVTPYIDALSEKSIVFTNAYTTAPHSDYAQLGLLSSRYMLFNKYQNQFTDQNPKKFAWDVFKENGYITGYFSSQNDQWQNMNNYLNCSKLDVYSHSITDGITDYGSGLANKDYDHKTVAKALEWLDSLHAEEKPFFMYINLQATHDTPTYPYEYSYFKPDNSKSVFSRSENLINRYDNSLRYVDIQIGKITDFLEKNNLTNTTIITLTSDHGHDLESRHDIYGHGNSLYNEELIIPAIAFLPGVKHITIDEPVSSIDFLPTLIDLMGYPIPKEFQGDVMRKGKPIFFVTQSHKYMIGMMRNNTKVILDINRGLSEVYDLKNDPHELSNLGSENYPDDTIQLLFWHYCQKDYYENKRWETGLNNRCSKNNNFKI